MRILFVLEHFYPYIGGAENLFWELGRSLVLNGHEVGVVTTRHHKSLASEEIIEGITIHRVSCYNRFLFSFFSLGKIWRVLSGYELIQTTSYNAALPAWIAAKLKRKPVIITFHEVWGALWWKLPFTSLVLKAGYFCWEQFILHLPFDRVIAVSKATRSALLLAGVPSSKVDLIYNGLNYKEFEHIQWSPPNQFTYTYFGRLGTSKGLELLLPAANKFAQIFPESKFKLIIPTYPAPIYKWVMDRIEEWNLHGHIIVMHDLSRERLFEEVRTSSCVVIPSHSEGFCFVAAEVVAMGVPLVSSQRTALKEVAGGRLMVIEPLDTGGIYQALEKAQNQEWSDLPRVEFPLEASVAQYIQLFKKLI